MRIESNLLECSQLNNYDKIEVTKTELQDKQTNFLGRGKEKIENLQPLILLKMSKFPTENSKSEHE